MTAGDNPLPLKIDKWSRDESPQRIDANNIFDYMNGAGELYLGYRFRGLQVFDYRADDRSSILVELYFMETSDDAYGLLSLDWGGEPVDLGSNRDMMPDASKASTPSALYGMGLLRIWSDNLYVRILASRETPASRKAVMDLGRAVVTGRKPAPAPDLVHHLPTRVGEAWKLRRDRITFLRSYLVLNSAFYVSHENILELNLDTEAVTAPYESGDPGNGSRRSQLLLVKYPNGERAREALAQFHDAYLPEREKPNTGDGAGIIQGTYKVEDGYLTYQVKERFLAVVFDSPDERSGERIIAACGRRRAGEKNE